MKIIFVVALAVIAAAIFLLRNQQETLITGSMTIQKMLCQENDDNSVTFFLTAFNTTNQRLNNLNVGLNIASESNSRQETINMRLVEEGDAITLEQVIAFEDEVIACFAKFMQGEQEISANFRPSGGKREENN